MSSSLAMISPTTLPTYKVIQLATNDLRIDPYTSLQIKKGVLNFISLLFFQNTIVLRVYSIPLYLFHV